GVDERTARARVLGVIRRPARQLERRRRWRLRPRAQQLHHQHRDERHDKKDPQHECNVARRRRSQCLTVGPLPKTLSRMPHALAPLTMRALAGGLARGQAPTPSTVPAPPPAVDAGAPAVAAPTPKPAPKVATKKKRRTPPPPPPPSAELFAVNTHETFKL